jgi:MinD-like ATPase involved in chromosome partitioning or flagellar assembly
VLSDFRLNNLISPFSGKCFNLTQSENGWHIAYAAELPDLYILPSNVKIDKLRNLRNSGYAARVEQQEMHTKFW